MSYHFAPFTFDSLLLGAGTAMCEWTPRKTGKQIFFRLSADTPPIWVKEKKMVIALIFTLSTETKKKKKGGELGFRKYIIMLFRRFFKICIYKYIF